MSDAAEDLFPVDGAAADALRRDLETAILDVLGAHRLADCIVTGWVVAFTATSPDDDRQWVQSVGAPGQPPMTTLGILTQAQYDRL